MVYMSSKAIAYLQLTSLEGFVDELKRRGLYEARLSEWIQRREMFETRKLRLTALDPYNNIILRYDLTYYRGLAQEPESEELKKLRNDAERRIVEKLGSESVTLYNGEYHFGRPEF
jgi:hypothetical protein